MRKVLISLIALPVMVSAGTVVARAAVYSLDDVYAGMFTITDVYYPALDEERHIQNWTDPAFLNETLSADSFLLDGWSMAKSNLAYSTTSTTITASGSVINQAFLGNIDGVSTQTESYVGVLFSVPVPTLYQLDATVSRALNGGTSPTAVARVMAFDWGTGASGFAASAMTNQTISSTGTLSPAQYRLMGHVKILDGVGSSGGILSIDSNSTFQYQLTLTPIPEPSTLVLLSMAAAGLVVYVLRKRR